MNPLTLDCARVRQELSAHYDGALDEAEAAFVDAHLAGCEGCRAAHVELGSALAALATLDPEDLARLSQPLASEGELDARPFAHVVFGGLLLLLVIATGAALLSARSHRGVPPAPRPTATIQIPVPSIGFDVGVERETPRASSAPSPSLPTSRLAPRPELIPQEALLAALPRGPEPQPLARKPAQPVPPQGPKKPVAPQAKKKKELPPPLPEPTATFLARLRVSQGLGYRGITLHFLQDPQGRDRLTASKGPALTPTSEGNPSVPEEVSVRPPRGRSGATILVGELLDAPAGLRIALDSFPLASSRTTVAVVPVAYEGLQRRRPEPVLKAPVLLPSAARLALLTNAQPGAVALLLKDLTHNAFSEIQRLRLELSRLESEAKALEQRLRARIRNTRGLRGLAVSIDGWPRTSDVFGSARALAEALPKLLRTALLEAHLKSFGPDDETVDWASTKILGGENQTRDRHKQLLALLVNARKCSPPRPLHSKISAIYRSPQGNTGVGVVHLSNSKVFHAVVVAPPPR